MKPRPEGAPGGVRAITSLQNERVKLIRSLRMRKARRETGLFVAEGTSVLVAARDAGWTPAILVYLAGSATAGVPRDLVRWAETAGAECLEVSQAVLGKLAARDNPQTMLGVFEQRWQAAPPQAVAGSDVLWVVLEGVRDPGNLGTIIRTVDAVGAGGIVLVGASVDPYSPEAVRATMGSIFGVPLVRLRPEEGVEWVSRWPGDIVGTRVDAAQDFRSAAYRRPALLVMGSEGPGLSHALSAACTRLVRIPMAGRLDSLNLAVATALMLYEMRREQL